MAQPFFHLTFVLSFLAFTAIRIYFHSYAQRTAGKVTYIEGRTNTRLRKVFGLPFITLLFVYMIFPSILAFAVLPLPEWMQWVGAAMCFGVLPGILWVQLALGSNFATTLHVRDEHTLVTGGPYRWVRHPMYSLFFLQAIGILLLTRNLFIGGIYLLGLTLVMATRVAREEQTMLEKFGDTYRAYMQTTGQFLPRL